MNPWRHFLVYVFELKSQFYLELFYIRQLQALDFIANLIEITMKSLIWFEKS